MKTIYLISGHGDTDSGATSVINNVNRKEAEETIKLVRKVINELNNYDCNVNYYDFDRDAFQDYKNGKFTLSKNIDALLEIHFNAITLDKGDNKIKGCESYIPSNHIEQSEVLATDLITAITSNTLLTNRGVKKGNFSIIKYANSLSIPSTLLEVCFIDDTDDMNYYDKSIDTIAKLIAETLANFVGAKKKVLNLNCSDWAKEACTWAVQNELIKGNDKGNYNWKSNLNREQFATVLYRFYKEFIDK